MPASPLSVSEISARLARHLCLQEGRTLLHRFARILRLNDLKSLKPHVFKPQIFVPLFKNDDLLVRHGVAQENFSHIRSTANSIKTVCTVNAGHEKERNG